MLLVVIVWLGKIEESSKFQNKIVMKFDYATLYRLLKSSYFMPPKLWKIFRV
jgi:hypothetical protein